MYAVNVDIEPLKERPYLTINHNKKVRSAASPEVRFGRITTKEVKNHESSWLY